MTTARHFAVATSLLLLLLGCAPGAASEAPVVFETDDQKALYAIGLAIASQLSTFGLTEADLALVQAGLTDGALGREPKVNLQEYGPKIQALGQARTQAKAAQEQQAAAGFLEAEAAKPGAVKTESGLVYTELVAGSGASPGATEQVSVHYHGSLRDGSVFDSSVERGEPASFRLNQVIKCWTEGVQKMKAGGKSRLVCPSSIAYGDQGRPPKIPPGAPLVFEVELLSVGTPEPPPQPAPPPNPPNGG